MAINALFKNIADAIRTKGETSDTLTPTQMPQAILDLPSGGGSNALMQFLTDTTQHSTYEYTQTKAPNVTGYKSFVAASTNIQNFIDNIATINHPSDATNITITDTMLLYSIDEFLNLLPHASREYQGNINQTIITDYNLTLLCDAHSGHAETKTLTLLDSVNNYDAIIINGIYREDTASSYNTTMCYDKPALNVDYWSGMKDRNKAYDCYVRFTDDTTAYLHGSEYLLNQCIIYGIN